MFFTIYVIIIKDKELLKSKPLNRKFKNQKQNKKLINLISVITCVLKQN